MFDGKRSKHASYPRVRAKHALIENSIDPEIIIFKLFTMQRLSKVSIIIKL